LTASRPGQRVASRAATRLASQAWSAAEGSGSGEHREGDVVDDARAAVARAAARVPVSCRSGGASVGDASIGAFGPLSVRLRFAHAQTNDVTRRFDPLARDRPIHLRRGRPDRHGRVPARHRGRHKGRPQLRDRGRPIDRTPGRERLRAAYPDCGLVGEEEGPDAAGATVCWYIDPIDATANFVRGIPIFATLLAVAVEGELQLGAVSAPAMRERWVAWRGGERGAATNGWP